MLAQGAPDLGGDGTVIEEREPSEMVEQFGVELEMNLLG
jgi:hypothetical protein